MVTHVSCLQDFGFKLLGIPRLPTTNCAIAYSLKATLSTSIHDGYPSLPTQADYIPNDEYGRISCFLTNSIRQPISFFITAHFSSTGLVSSPSHPSLSPSRNFLRVSSKCARL